MHARELAGPSVGFRFRRSPEQLTMEIDSRRDKFLALLDERNLGVVRSTGLLATCSVQSRAVSMHRCSLGMLHGACRGRITRRCADHVVDAAAAAARAKGPDRLCRLRSAVFTPPRQDGEPWSQSGSPLSTLLDPRPLGSS